jgi:hypothetical protein
MSGDLEDSRQWRDSVEARLGRLETTVEEQARLRAAMDEDLSKLHVERKLLQSLHDTQQEHTAQLRELREGQGELRTVVERVHVGVEAIRGLLDRNLDSGEQVGE